MKKIIISLSIISAVAALAIVGTVAYFSDTETSTGNTFTAGSVDLKVDSTQHYNNAVCVGGFWALESLASPTVPQYPVIGTVCGGTWGQPNGKDIVGEKFFNFDDVKPGDSGENTVSLHVVNNDAYICGYVTNLTNNDNGINEPESAVDSTDGVGNGELQNNILVTIWKDKGSALAHEGACNNILDPNEDIYVVRQPIDSNIGSMLLGHVAGDKTVCLGVKWEVPSTVGNIIQSDSVTGDISFYAEQYRNNPSFTCPTSLTKTLVLEDKTAGWDVIVNNTQGTLTYNTAGDTFDYTFQAIGLTKTTQYSLIYYADKDPRFQSWGGNNPGAVIDTFTTNGSGNIPATSGSTNLGMDLPASPDWNISPSPDYCDSHNGFDDYNTCAGAKIWLVPSADLTGGVLPLATWNPSTYLFETDLITYDDTNN